MYALSLFRGMRDTQPQRVTLDEVVTMMRTDQSVRDLTDKHRYARSTGDEQGARHYKQMMTNFGVAARFEGGRRQQHIVALTGLSLVDIDHIPPERMGEVLALVHGDPHTLLAYITLSGHGLRIIFRYEVEALPNPPCEGRDSDIAMADDGYPLRSVAPLSPLVPLKEGQCSLDTTIAERDSAESAEDNTNQKELSPFKGDERSGAMRNGAEGVKNSAQDDKPDVKQGAEHYGRAFLQGNAHYETLTGLPADGQCKNIGRVSAIAYDPDLYYNPGAVPFTVAPEDKRPVGRPKKGRDEKARVDCCAAAALRELERRGVVYEPGNHNKYISDACYLMNRYGVAEEDCTAWALKTFADYAATDDVPAIVRSCYRHTDEHGTRRPHRTGKGERKYASVEEIEDFLTRHVELRYNTVSRLVEIRYPDDTPWKPLEDKDLNSLWRMMNKQCSVRVIKDDMYSIMRSDYPTTYNPFGEYIQSLPKWDGTTDYIARLASSVTVESDADEWCHVFRKWFVSFIAAIFSTEEVNHEILVFIGEQGKYKSTWFYYLLPPELRRYFLIKLMDGAITKDDLINIAQSGLVCLEEIDNMKQKELNQLKALTTMRTINVRRPYGHFNEVLPHIASFCATGNNRYYLTDRTANRRFLTFEVTHIETPQDYDFQYAGLYAQAYALWKQGFRYWFDEQENRATNERNRAFEAPDSEYELVAKYYRRPIQGEPCKFLTASDVLERLSATVHGLSTVKIGMALGKLGTPRVRIGGKYGYRLVELTPADIEARQRIPDDGYSEQPSSPVDPQAELSF